jgi:hypothetical protein
MQTKNMKQLLPSLPGFAENMRIIALAFHFYSPESEASGNVHNLKNEIDLG